tara:strand:- start:123 stop:341 length:219 start_codon:yes stop_codon:yes gene_type:complete
MTVSFDEITAYPYRRLSADYRIDLQPGRAVHAVIIGEKVDNEQTKPLKKGLPRQLNRRPRCIGFVQLYEKSI